MDKDTHLLFEEYEDVVANVPKSMSHGLKVITKLDKNDLDKSEVMVQGYGVVTLGSLKSNTAGKLEDLAGRIRKNEPDFALKRIIEKHGILMLFIKTLVLAEKDIEHMRRAGQLPGLAKRYLQ